MGNTEKMMVLFLSEDNEGDIFLFNRPSPALLSVARYMFPKMAVSIYKHPMLSFHHNKYDFPEYEYGFENGLESLQHPVNPFHIHFSVSLLSTSTSKSDIYTARKLAQSDICPSNLHFSVLQCAKRRIIKELDGTPKARLLYPS